MLRNRMLADPSFLFKVGTEVCFVRKIKAFFRRLLCQECDLWVLI